MISRTYAAQQIARFTVLDYFPKDNDIALKEILDAMQSCSQSEAHCKRIADEWIESERVYPKPADLRTLADNLPNPAESTARGCQRCHGTGWIHESRMQRDPITGIDYALEGSRRCQCVPSGPTEAKTVNAKKAPAPVEFADSGRWGE